VSIHESRDIVRAVRPRPHDPLPPPSPLILSLPGEVLRAPTSWVVGELELWSPTNKKHTTSNAHDPLDTISGDGERIYMLSTGGPVAQVCRLGQKVGGRLALFCIHRLNSHNDYESQ